MPIYQMKPSKLLDVIWCARRTANWTTKCKLPVARTCHFIV